ncbi:MAG TPA: hypothetical protein VEH28_08645 [Thermoplasmata archaeon]|nr:hypothetical protein [Thermoplasmata archaeon]
MAVSRPVPPNVPTSDTAYPGMAEMRAKAGGRTFQYLDFAWLEDVVAAWRAVALLGGLLFVEGLIFWLGAVGYGDTAPIAALIAAAAFLLFGCAVVAFLGYAEASLAMVAALGVTIGLVVFDPPLPISSAASLFNDPSARVPDLYTVLILWTLGAVLLVVGVVQAVVDSRKLDRDEE